MPYLFAAGCELSAQRGRSLPQKHKLHQRDRLRQTEASSVSDYGRGYRSLYKRYQHLAKGK